MEDLKELLFGSRIFDKAKEEEIENNEELEDRPPTN